MPPTETQADYPNIVDFIPDDGRPARELFDGDVDGLLREIVRLGMAAASESAAPAETMKVEHA